MEQTLEKQIETYVKEHQLEAEELLETLGKIPAPTRKEDRRALFCREWFLKHGGENVWIDDAKNVICAWRTDECEELVVFAAHTDVVFADENELPMKREGNILYAPGIGDDTANLVNLMMGAEFIMEHHLKTSKGILFVANACEEGMGNLDGCKEIFKTYGKRIREFYSFDGYMSQCTSFPVGSHRYRITARVKGGHSYLNFGEDNAIAILGELIHEMYRTEVPVEDKTTYNVGYMQGGTTVNSLAQEAYMLYEYRSPSEKCLKIMKEKLDCLIGRFLEKGKNITVELLGVRPGKGIFPEGALEAWTEENIRIIRKFYDGPMDLQPYSTDSNIPLSMGILANTIGTIKGGAAHTREEWVDLDSQKAGMRIVLELMGKYIIQERTDL